MNDHQFTTIVEEICRRIPRTLGMKSKEYARGDRLSNFKRAAKALQTTPERACVGFAMKHIVSILDMVDDIDNGSPPWAIELWQEKIGDALNYLVLLQALVVERWTDQR